MSAVNKSADPSSTKKNTRPETGEGNSATVDGPDQLNGKSPRKRPQKPVEILLGDKVHDGSGNFTKTARLVSNGGVIGLYFSAHWCPPCLTFTPRLKLLYEELKKKEKPFEVVYISFDQCERSFNEYLAKMPWWAVDFHDEDKREELAHKFSISGVPVLVLLDSESLQVITHAGRDVVTVDPRGDYFPWKEMPDIEELQRSLQAAMELEAERERQEAELTSFGDDTLPKSCASASSSAHEVNTLSEDLLAEHSGESKVKKGSEGKSQAEEGSSSQGTTL